MSEGLNTEVAQYLTESEGEKPDSQKTGRFQFELTEIAEAILLAAVAIVTAWSGYQAAQWDGKNALYYEHSATEHRLAARQTTLAGQELLYDTTTLNSWDAANTAGRKDLASRFVRRFTPDYRTEFHAWLKLDPLHNSKAPPVPSSMPGYQNPAQAKAQHLDAEAEVMFNKGTEARHVANEYLRGTVLLATVLFLVAIGQRFKVRRVRRAMLGVSLVIIVYTLIALSSYPRL